MSDFEVGVVRAGATIGRTELNALVVGVVDNQLDIGIAAKRITLTPADRQFDIDVARRRIDADTAACADVELIRAS